MKNVITLLAMIVFILSLTNASYADETQAQTLEATNPQATVNTDPTENTVTGEETPSEEAKQHPDANSTASSVAGVAEKIHNATNLATTTCVGLSCALVMPVNIVSGVIGWIARKSAGGGNNGWDGVDISDAANGPPPSAGYTASSDSTMEQLDKTDEPVMNAKQDPVAPQTSESIPQAPAGVE